MEFGFFNYTKKFIQSWCSTLILEKSLKSSNPNEHSYVLVVRIADENNVWGNVLNEYMFLVKIYLFCIV